MAAHPAVAATDCGSARGDGQHRRCGGRVRGAVNGRHGAIYRRHRAIDGRHRAVDGRHGAIGRGAQYRAHKGHRQSGGGTKFDGLVGDRSASAIRHKGSRQKKEIERGLTRPSRKRQSEHREKTTAGAARERGLFTSTRFFRSPDLRAACRVAVASIDRFAALRSPVLLPCWPHLPFFPPALSLL